MSRRLAWMWNCGATSGATSRSSIGTERPSCSPRITWKRSSGFAGQLPSSTTAGSCTKAQRRTSLPQAISKPPILLPPVRSRTASRGLHERHRQHRRTHTDAADDHQLDRPMDHHPARIVTPYAGADAGVHRAVDFGGHVHLRVWLYRWWTDFDH